MKAVAIFMVLFLVASCGKDSKEKSARKSELTTERRAPKPIKPNNRQTLHPDVLAFCQTSRDTVSEFKRVVERDSKFYSSGSKKEAEGLGTLMGSVAAALVEYDLKSAKDRAQKALDKMIDIPELKKRADRITGVLEGIIAAE